MKISEKEEIERIKFATELLIKELEKEYVDSRVIELFEKAEIITIERD